MTWNWSEKEFWECPLCDQELKVRVHREWSKNKVAWCSKCDLDIQEDLREKERMFFFKDQDITFDEILRMKKLRSFE